MTTVGAGEEEHGGLRQTVGTEEGEEVKGVDGTEVSKTCSSAWFKFEGTSPTEGSTVGVAVLANDGTEAGAGCRRGWVEWIEAGAVLGPRSN